MAPAARLAALAAAALLLSHAPGAAGQTCNRWYEPCGYMITRFIALGAPAPTARVRWLVQFHHRNADRVSADIFGRNITNATRYPTVAEHLALTGPTAAERAAVAAWLLGAAPGVVLTNLSHAIVVNSTAAEVAAIFGKALVAYRDDKTQGRPTILRIAPADSVAALESALPAGVRSRVLGVFGLTGFPPLVRKAGAQRPARRLQANNNQAMSTAPLYTLDVFRAQYNVPATVSTPQGPWTVACSSSSCVQMVAEYSYSAPTFVAQADWLRWNAGMGVPNAPSTYATALGYGASNLPLTGTFSDETSLDTQWIGGIGAINGGSAATWIYNDQAPQDALPFWAEFGQSILDAYTANPVTAPRVISISYGFTELAQLSGDGVSAADNIFSSLAHVGVTVVVSSGDNGAFTSGSCTDKPSASYPATSPYVLAVGATQPLGAVNSSYAPFTTPTSPLCLNPPSGFNCFQPQFEMGCSSGNGQYITSGGGFSMLESMPPWQSAAVNAYVNAMGGAMNLNLPTGVQPGAARAVPDVSINGAANLYITCPAGAGCPFGNGGFTIIAGTSASAPTWAAILTLANQLRASQGLPPLGFVNQMLYQLAAQYSGTASVFVDITQGDNSCMESQSPPAPNCPAGCVGYKAAAGWDPVTGLGTPNVNGLLYALAGLTPPAAAAPVWQTGPPQTAPPSGGSSGLSTGAIAGIAVGCVLFCALIIGFGCLGCSGGGKAANVATSKEPASYHHTSSHAHTHSHNKGGKGVAGSSV